MRKNRLILEWTIRSKDDLEYAQNYCDNFICETIYLDNIESDFKAEKR